VKRHPAECGGAVGSPTSPTIQAHVKYPQAGRGCAGIGTCDAARDQSREDALLPEKDAKMVRSRPPMPLRLGALQEGAVRAHWSGAR
jgi:hypothetical protein